VSPLGQLEAFDPPPTRRLIVPEGHTAWLGIDPGATRVAVASVAADGARGVSEAVFPRRDGGERLASIYTRTLTLVREIVDVGIWPGVVVVEQPSGKRPNPPLSYATGVIMAAAFEAVMRGTGSPVPVETVPSSTWKRVACGHGGIRKPTAQGEPYGVLMWARSVGYVGTSWDCADAYGVAEMARKTFLLEER
jgi:hypothetical protein